MEQTKSRGSRYQRGVEAERVMASEVIQQLALNSVYDVRIVKDVCYKTKNGKYAQVDGMLLCSRGIFCIEFKSWEGEVAPTREKDWLVRIQEYKAKYPNPVIQNGWHALALNSILNKNLTVEGSTESYNLRSLVIFDKKTKIFPSEFRNVINVDNVAKYIGRFNDDISTFDLDRVEDFLIHLSNTNLKHFQKQNRGIINKAESNITRF